MSQMYGPPLTSMGRMIHQAPGELRSLDMDHTLRCNQLKCRKPLAQRALVTSCGHIICIECVQNLGFNVQQNGRSRRHCPVCNAELANHDDAVITNLNPSEQYKSNVLSGLTPNVIMECAGRAINFWSYQTAQEAYFQDHMCKILKEKHAQLQVTVDKVSNDANSQLASLQEKVTSCETESDMYRRKLDELTLAYREKHRKLIHIQELYDKAKRASELGQLQQAAFDAVNDTMRDGEDLAASQSQHFDRNANARDMGSLPSVPLFGVAHRGVEMQSTTMNTAAQRTGQPPAGDGRWAREESSGQSTYSLPQMTSFRRPGQRFGLSGGMNPGAPSFERNTQNRDLGRPIPNGPAYPMSRPSWAMHELTPSELGLDSSGRRR